jgi:preflagellin peptidase FlaK
MIAPLVIGSIAIVVTLCYASVLDIRERRVPFRTWYPMLAVAGPMAALFYIDYELGLTPDRILSYATCFMVTALLLTLLDLVRDRVTTRTAHTRGEIVETAIAMSLVALPVSTALYGVLALGDTRGAIIAWTAFLFILLIYLCGSLHLFGWADAWVLIFIAACVPFFPIVPALGVPNHGSFPFSVFFNAVMLNLATPVGIFAANILRGNHAPLRYMFVGFPVDGSSVQHSFGYIIEEFEETDGKVNRRFIPFRHALSRMIRGKRRMYTRDLKRHPEAYAGELELYRKAGTVWISYATPFIIPITAGFLTAFFIGDLIFTLMKILIGG